MEQEQQVLLAECHVASVVKMLQRYSVIWTQMTKTNGQYLRKGNPMIMVKLMASQWFSVNLKNCGLHCLWIVCKWTLEIIGNPPRGLRHQLLMIRQEVCVEMHFPWIAAQFTLNHNPVMWPQTEQQINCTFPLFCFMCKNAVVVGQWKLVHTSAEIVCIGFPHKPVCNHTVLVWTDTGQMWAAGCVQYPLPITMATGQLFGGTANPLTNSMPRRWAD